MGVLEFLLIYSPFVIVAAFVGLILFMLYRDHQEAENATKHADKSKNIDQVEGVPDSNIVESLHDIKIKYNGVIITNDQQI